MTWYLGITTTRLIAPTPGAEKERGEFAVERQLRALGLQAHAPRKIEFKRVGKKRYPDPVTSAYLPSYIFAEIPAAKFAAAIQCNGLRPTMMAIPQQEVRRHVLSFIDRVAAENMEAERIVASRDRAAMCQFKPGQALEVFEGPFKDRILHFQRMVQAAHDMHPMIEAEVEIFGRAVRVKADPLDVKGVA
ncbi:hypothetical protein [Pseudophaeobacter sp.]|uniref:transcription termination/antitermination protein NusG n=1 Tax=Pseudophaeobacter sp. TaxID=1971739 RepID=UPI00326E6521